MAIGKLDPVGFMGFAITAMASGAKGLVFLGSPLYARLEAKNVGENPIAQYQTIVCVGRQEDVLLVAANTIGLTSTAVDLAAHRTATPIDHPDASVTTEKLAAQAATEAIEKMNPGGFNCTTNNAWVDVTNWNQVITVADGDILVIWLTADIYNSDSSHACLFALRVRVDGTPYGQPPEAWLPPSAVYQDHFAYSTVIAITGLAAGSKIIQVQFKVRDAGLNPNAGVSSNSSMVILRVKR